MKKILPFLLVFVFLLSGCAAQQKAIYLRSTGNPVFTDEQLKKYKEVKVVDQFSQLEQNLQQPVAIWIDKYVLAAVPKDWLKMSPQKDYPIAVIGYNEPVHVFGTLLPVDFPWPQRDPNKTDLPEGFSVWKQTGEHKGIIKGFNPPFDVKKVLEVTNRLLKNEMPE